MLVLVAAGMRVRDGTVTIGGFPWHLRYSFST